MRKALLVLTALALAATGCRVRASASVNSQKQREAELEDEPPAAGRGEAEPLTSDFALLGARHDLRLAQDKKTPVCSCLAVAIGAPNDPSFTWDSGAPAIDPETQLVVAVSSDGIACAGAKDGALGASYWGYRLSGDDVIVIVENARTGRPVTAGAIIPKPVGSGQVYVRAADKHVPYGRPLAATDKVCKIGNPGPARTTPSTGAKQPEEEQNW